MIAAVVGAIAAVLLATGLIDAGGDDRASGEARLPPSLVGVSPQTSLDEQDFNNMGAAGVGILRVPMSWDAVQFSPGDCEPAPVINTCDWGPTDVVVGNAAERGIRVLPVLSNVPRFAGENHNAPPLGDLQRLAWAGFLDAAVRRYGPGGEFWENEYADPNGPFEGEPQPIVEWQIWNEPNGKVFFHPKPDPRKYGKLVKISARTIKAVDPEAKIVLAGMFGTAAIPLPRFLEGLYDVKGVEDAFDAIAVHPYASGIRGLKVQIRWARREAREAGDEDVGLWITELGWGSGDGGHPLEKGKKGQSRLLTKSFELLSRRREAWNVGGVVWFTWQDRRDKAVCRFCTHAGLFDPAGRPKPAWAAFRNAIEPAQ